MSPLNKLTDKGREEVARIVRTLLNGSHLSGDRLSSDTVLAAAILTAGDQMDPDAAVDDPALFAEPSELVSSTAGYAGTTVELLRNAFGHVDLDLGDANFTVRSLMDDLDDVVDRAVAGALFVPLSLANPGYEGWIDSLIAEDTEDTED